MAENTHILVLGGGFAGIYTVMALEKRFKNHPEVAITLISRENFFLFTPLLAEVAVGTVDPRHIVSPVREICRKTIFHRAEVLALDLNMRQVRVAYNGLPWCQETLGYDHLVVALGSESSVMPISGLEQNAFYFKELGDAILLRNHILEMFERADTTVDKAQREALLTFSVIGAGYSGVEVAAAIRQMADRACLVYPDITPEDVRVLLVEASNQVLSNLPKALAAYAVEELEQMGVTLLLGQCLEEVSPTWIRLANGRQIGTCTVVWTAGVKASSIAQALPVIKGHKNTPIAKNTLQLPPYENVWVAGDNAWIPMPGQSGIYYPQTAQVAIATGMHVAANIAAGVLQGKVPKGFEYHQKGEMVVLGERSAVAVVYGIKLKGWWAWLLWRVFYLTKLPRFKKKIRVAFDWLLGAFGPVETTQLKPYARLEPCDITPKSQMPNISEKL